MQQLEVGLPGQVLMEKRLFGADGYTDKPFFCGFGTRTEFTWNLGFWKKVQLYGWFL
jgi:hypothetical protein